MRKECLDRSLGCEDTLTTYGGTSCMASARTAISLGRKKIRDLQCLNLGLLYSSLRGSLHLRRPHGRFSACKNRQDQRCKEFLMHNALRVLPVVHKGALPITNTAHSQHQQHLESHHD